MSRGALVLLALLAAAAPALAPAGAAGQSGSRPVCTYIPPLRYPPALAAERPRMSGTVLVRVQVDADGRVAAAELLRSNLPELFTVEALRTVRQSRFLPAPDQRRGERRSLILLLRFPADGAPGGLGSPSSDAGSASGDAGPAAASAPSPPAARASPIAAAPGTSAAPAAPAAAGKGSLRLLDAGFGRSVENRRLLGRGEVFGVNDRVYFWMEVEGARVGQVLRHVWIFRGREMQEIALTLKAERWATWSYKTFFPGQTGAWLLELRDEEDDLLGSWSCFCE